MALGKRSAAGNGHCCTGTSASYSLAVFGIITAPSSDYVDGPERCNMLMDVILDVVRTLAPVVTAACAVVTAGIALTALKNWQRQDKAKREAEFLDALVDAVHTYVAAMSEPIALLDFARIGMESHAPPGSSEQAGISVEGAIAYIHKRGEQEAKRLFEALAGVRPTVVKLTSLAAKGQVFSFNGYAKCRHAVEKLTWQFGRIEAFTAIISSPSSNWEHPLVLKNLKNMMAIGPEDIRKGLADDNVAVLAFVSDTYKRIYGQK